MLPSMRFYIISIVSIFAALGIGIFIGFTMNTQDFIVQQKDSITKILESQFETLMSENKNLKAEVNELETENMYKNEYIESSYSFIIRNKLKGVNVGIIETNEDYITSGIGKDLELAGAKIVNVTTLNNSIINKEQLDNVYKDFNINIPRDSVDTAITTIVESIISGVPSPMLDEFIKENFIGSIGNYNESVDYLVICGGSFNEAAKRINQVDRLVVKVAKNYNIPILGVEKSKVEYSYMPKYKDLGISTVDNIDMVMGKVAMVLVMEGLVGNYGIKETSDSIIPSTNNMFQQ